MEENISLSIKINNFAYSRHSITKKKRILVLGAPGVGKTSLISQFQASSITETNCSEMKNSEITTKFVNFNSENVELEILDLNGKTEYSVNSYSKFYHGIDGYALVFSHNNRESFDRVKKIASKVSVLIGSFIPFVLVGNKSDTSATEVPESEAKYFANHIKVPYVKSSVAIGSNINLVFLTLLNEIDKFEQNSKQTQKCEKITNCFVAYPQCTSILYLLLLCLATLSSIFYIVYGFIEGMNNQTSPLVVGAFLLSGFWLFLFNMIGLYGHIKCSTEYMAYYNAGLIFSLILLIAVIVLRIILNNYKGYANNTTHNTVLYFVTGLCFFVKTLLIFFSIVYKFMFTSSTSQIFKFNSSK